MKKFFTMVLSAGLAGGVLAATNEIAAGLDASGGGAGKKVFIIPIEDAIEPALLYVVKRGVREAKAADAAAVVIEMDTPGGTLGAAEEICREISSLKMPAYTLVKNHAFSAGAIIALSTKKIFMQPGSVIGDAMPIMVSQSGDVEPMPADLKEKTVSAVCAMIRANAQQNGHDPELAECMVRIEKEYSIGEDFEKEEGKLLTLTDIEAAKMVGEEGEAKRPLLSAGTVQDRAEMLARVGLTGAEVVELRVTMAEQVARWLAAISPILMMIGGLGLYLEFKAPGQIWPGVIGAVFMMLFFWGHHIAGLSGMEDVVLFILGVALIVVEIYIWPGHVVPGLVGGLCILLAMLMAMVDAPPVLPAPGPETPLPILALPTWEQLQGPLFKLSLTVIGTTIGISIIAPRLPHTNFASPLVLARELDAKAGYVASASDAALVGQTGEAVSALRPSGTAKIAGRRLDVVSSGGFIEAGAKVRVVEAGGRIVVEAA